MSHWLLAALIGFISGVLSGAFGIGGGIITTPAIRLLLDAPALVAVGTPLPVIFPSAITGALQYRKAGQQDMRAGVIIGLSGVATAVLGAWLTRLVGGTTVLLGTAVLILWAAGDMIAQVLRPPKVRAAFETPVAADLAAESASEAASSPVPPATPVKAPVMPLVAIGALTGLYSGFFGLGGGFVVVPMLSRWVGFPVKRAVGTSLVAVALLAIPGTITHALLGNIDWAIALGLAVGVVPGAFTGSKLSLRSGDRAIRIGFATLLVVTAVWLAASEIVGLAR